MTEDTLLAGIGANIANRRRSTGLTQAGLADRIGRSVQWISAVEQGRRRADRLPDLTRIAAALGCTFEELIGCPVGALPTLLAA